MPNELLSLLGLDHLTGSDAEAALKRIISDNLVLTRAQELANRQFIVQAVRDMHILERQRLAKHACGGLQQQKSAHVSWFVETGLISHRLHIRAVCAHGKSWWDCKPDELGPAKHCNESLPDSIRAEYTQRWTPPTSVGDDMARMYAAAQQPRAISLSELREREGK
jgi:hypothetical protein